MPARNNDLRAKFEAKFERRGRGECWPWLAAKTKRGYGHMRHLGVDIYAHRLAFEYERGPILPGLCVCHRCDNRACVNPAHLWLGTDADNMADRDAKGRAKWVGQAVPRKPKLCDFTVLLIRSSTLPSSELASLFGVSTTLVDKVRSGRKHSRPWLM